METIRTVAEDTYSYIIRESNSGNFETMCLYNRGETVSLTFPPRVFKTLVGAERYGEKYLKTR